MFVGSEGNLYATYSNYRLLPESKFKGFTPPPETIPNSIGHHREWIRACKTGGPTTCNFEYSGALTEAVLLGNVAFRAGETLRWDAEALRAVGCPRAEALIQKEYRSGWEVTAEQTA
jgi:hypothetical protein